MGAAALSVPGVSVTGVGAGENRPVYRLKYPALIAVAVPADLKLSLLWIVLT